MPFINVEVSQECADTAREAAAKAGMLLKKWVERAIVTQARAEAPNPQPQCRLCKQEYMGADTRCQAANSGGMHQWE